MSYKSALVHLSDIECGQESRAESESEAAGYERCARRLVDDIKGQLSRHQELSSAQVGLIVTGDSATKGKKTEFEKAEATIKLIRDSLGIPPDQVAVVPGNHDVSRTDCEEAFKARWPGLDRKDPTNRERARGLSKKLEKFGGFFHNVCSREFNGPETVVSFDAFSRLGIALVGLDTTYPCTFHPDDNYGLLRHDAVTAAGIKLKSMLEKDRQLVPVVAMHHCPSPLLDQLPKDKSYLYNATQAMDWLRDAGFCVVLCGHEHQQRSVLDLRSNYSVFAAGSYGLNLKGLRSRYHGEERYESNRYEIVLADPEGSSEFLLRKLRIPGSLDSEWVEDTDYGPATFPFHLRRPQIDEPSGPSVWPPVNLFVSHPYQLGARQRWVVSLSLGGALDSLNAISSVTYRVGDVTKVRENREVGFRTDVEVQSISQAQVEAELRQENGQVQTVTRYIPSPL